MLRLHRIGLPGTERVPRFNASEPTQDLRHLFAIKRDKMFEMAKGMIQSRLGKVVWTIGIISITLARLPFWLVYYAPRDLRQHPKWTCLQAIKHRLVRILLYHSSLMEVRTPIELEPGVEKDRFAKIEPARKDIYQGVLADSNIKPATTGGL